MAEVTLRTFADTVHTSVASSATSVALIAANTRRKAIIFQNTSTAILYIYLNGAAGAATATTAEVIIAGGHLIRTFQTLQRASELTRHAPSDLVPHKR